MKVRLKPEPIHEYMLTHSLGQNEVARLAGISHATLSALMNGKRFAGPAVRKALMRALRVKKWDTLFEVAAPAGKEC